MKPDYENYDTLFYNRKLTESEIDKLFRDVTPWWRYYRWKTLRFLRRIGKHARLRRQNET